MAIDASAIRELAKGDEGELLAELKAELLPPTIAAIAAALTPKCYACGKGAQRWAVRNVLELCKLVGAQPQVLLAVFEKVGVKNLDELNALANAGRRLEALSSVTEVSPEPHLEVACDVIRHVLAERPDLRSQALEALGLKMLEPHQNGNGAHE